MTMRDPDAPTCWTCKYQQVAGGNLLGFCRWFTVHKNEGAKAIPRDGVDEGCPMYEKKARP